MRFWDRDRSENVRLVLGIVGAVGLLALAADALANPPWRGHQSSKPRHWESYPTEFTRGLAGACYEGAREDGFSDAMAKDLCACTVAVIEDSVSYQSLMRADRDRVRLLNTMAIEHCAKERL